MSSNDATEFARLRISTSLPNLSERANWFNNLDVEGVEEYVYETEREQSDKYARGSSDDASDESGDDCGGQDQQPSSTSDVDLRFIPDSNWADFEYLTIEEYPDYSNMEDHPDFRQSTWRGSSASPASSDAEDHDYISNDGVSEYDVSNDNASNDDISNDDVSNGDVSNDDILSDNVCELCRGLEEKAFKSDHSYIWADTNYSQLAASAVHCIFCTLLVEALDCFGCGKDLIPNEDLLFRNKKGDKEVKNIHLWFKYTLYLEVRRGLEDFPRRIELYTTTNHANLPTSIKQRSHYSTTLNASLGRQVAELIGTPEQLSPLPTRILDVHLGAGTVDDVMLYDTCGARGSYVALSHCWVNRRILKTEVRTLQSHLAGICFQDLPPTFRDAIIICRWLGIQYLWIDALCIIQDDPEDMDRQISNMDQIFQNAFFTLAAHGRSERDTILPRSQQYYELTLGNQNVYVREIARHEFLEDDHAKRSQQDYTEIYSRGWCFQERLLSRQVLHITPDEILFEREGYLSNCQCLFHRGVVPARIQLRSSDYIPKSEFESWYDMVSEYSKLMFTHKSDLLPALAGVARFFQMNHQPHPGQYVAGLWENDLYKSLCWSSKEFIVDYFPERSIPSNGYFCPSFSWAARFGQIWFPFQDGRYRATAILIAFHNQPDPSNPFGRWLSCSVQLEGKLFPARGFSTIGKDRKYLLKDWPTEPGVEEAYIVPLAVAETSRFGGPNHDTWFEAMRAVSKTYTLDAYNDIPDDNELVYLFPLYHRKGINRRDSTETHFHNGLVLVSIPSLNHHTPTSQHSADSPLLPAFRRVGFYHYIETPVRPFFREEYGHHTAIELF